MASYFSISRAARHWIRLRLVPVLLAIAIALGLSTVSDQARADAPVSGLVFSACSTLSTSCPWARTAEELCVVPKIAVVQPLVTTVTSVSGAFCYYKKSDNTTGTLQMSSQARCADGSIPVSGPTNSQCGTPAPTCPAKGQTSSANYYTVVSDSQLGYSLDFCIPMTGTSGGCGMTASGRAGGLNKNSGKWEYQFMGPLTTTGQVCTGNGIGVTNPKTDTEAPQKCDKTAGMCTGTVNGVEVCVKCAQADTANTQTKTTTNPDGSTSQTTTNTTTTVNNSNVTTTTTTTTTTTPAGGGTPTTSTKTDSTTESKDSYCQRNPNDQACKSTSSLSGGTDCVTPPTCNGDAIQCAMVDQQWRTRCLFDKQSTLSDLGNSVTSGNDPDAGKHPQLEANRTVVDMSTRIDSTPFLTGGGALQDQVMPVNGRTVTIPLSKLNQYLVIVGNIFVAIALIGAAKIVTGGA